MKQNQSTRRWPCRRKFVIQSCLGFPDGCSTCGVSLSAVQSSRTWPLSPYLAQSLTVPPSRSLYLTLLVRRRVRVAQGGTLSVTHVTIFLMRWMQPSAMGSASSDPYVSELANERKGKSRCAEALLVRHCNVNFVCSLLLVPPNWKSISSYLQVFK